MLYLKIWTMSSGCCMAISLTIGIAGGVLIPGLPIPHRTLELLLPGFIWVSPGMFVLGLAESFFYGVYAGLLFALLHNFFARYWRSAQGASSIERAA